jgi:hypothetical protein
MWAPYLRVVKEKCSEALHILDRFHIVAKMNKALDEVRAEETRRMKREWRDSVLKKSRWLLLKPNENLGDEQHFRLRDILRYNLKTVRAYLLKEAFQQLWDYNLRVTKETRTDSVGGLQASGRIVTEFDGSVSESVRRPNNSRSKCTGAPAKRKNRGTGRSTGSPERHQK